MKNEILTVSIEQIMPDLNQPRKDFNAERLAELVSSVKRYGIMNPLVVEEAEGGKYLLVDGERRYKAAQSAGLKEVPIIVQESKGATDRLIRQFHLQQQHQDWSSSEKAVAVFNLAEQLDLPVSEITKVLAIPEQTIADYMAFGELANRSAFVRSKIPVGIARSIRGVTRTVKSLYRNRLKEEFTKELQEELEEAIIERVQKGQMSTDKKEYATLRDAFVTDPSLIKKFIEEKDITAEKMFLEAGAQLQYFVRNSLYALYQSKNLLKSARALGLDKVIDQDMKLSNAIRNLLAELKDIEPLLATEDSVGK